MEQEVYNILPILSRKEGKADAALAASVFHFKEIEIIELKKELRKQGIPVRI